MPFRRGTRRVNSGRTEQVRGRADIQPTVAEVVEAVWSLYAESLKPVSRILLKRLQERATVRAQPTSVNTSASEAAPLIDPVFLRGLVETCDDLHVEQESENEYSVLLRCHSGAFVDAGGSDCYPSQLWTQAAAYFGGLTGAERLLPGGRYACARELACRAPPFLHTCSLGQVCHIVQLAISKKLLGYNDGHIVPFCASESGMKECCAALRQPVHAGRGASQKLHPATWDEARTYLGRLLSRAAETGPAAISLCSIKQIFRSRFQVELSETALGYCRLRELLGDPRLRDICALRELPSGHVLVHPAAQHTLHVTAAAQWHMPHSAAAEQQLVSRTTSASSCASSFASSCTAQAAPSNASVLPTPQAIGSSAPASAAMLPFFPVVSSPQTVQSTPLVSAQHTPLVQSGSDQICQLAAPAFSSPISAVPPEGYPFLPGPQGMHLIPVMFVPQFADHLYSYSAPTYSYSR